MVYDTPMLLNISMSYTVGKLLKPTFQCQEVCNCAFEYLLPAPLSTAAWRLLCRSIYTDKITLCIIQVIAHNVPSTPHKCWQTDRRMLPIILYPCYAVNKIWMWGLGKHKSEKSVWICKSMQNIRCSLTIYDFDLIILNVNSNREFKAFIHDDSQIIQNNFLPYDSICWHEWQISCPL